MRKLVTAARRIVIKVGSALVTNNGAGLDDVFMRACARQLVALQDDGRDVILVSSGAIAAGMQKLGWRKRPHALHSLQAAAAVGQSRLTQAYENVFAEHGRTTAQILLTHADLADRGRYLNARSTLATLLGLKVIPIINENDTVVTDEIRFGDNDTLGALVANLIEAELLVIMTDQEGLYTADPRRHPAATLVSEGRALDPSLEAMAGGAASEISKGGMITKIKAAQRAARSGAHTLIISGRRPDGLLRALAGEPLGTFLMADTPPLMARKQWLADHLRVMGTVIIDAGAVRALRSGRSLLPIGIRRVEGDFLRGAVISCLDDDRVEIARGLTNYASSEIAKIAGHKSSEIESLLGYLDESEVIHRDNLVLL